jgi:hypothetical protein
MIMVVEATAAPAEVEAMMEAAVAEGVTTMAPVTAN